MCLRLHEFCFCCSNRVGSGIAALITALLCIDFLVDGVLDVLYAWNKFTNWTFGDIPLWLALAATSLALTSLTFIALGYLLMGLVQCRAKYVLPWLILIVVVVALTLFYEGFVMKEVFKNSSIFEMPPQHSISLLIKLLLLVFGIYLWMIVYSFYVDLSRFSRVY